MAACLGGVGEATLLAVVLEAVVDGALLLESSGAVLFLRGLEDVLGAAVCCGGATIESAVGVEKDGVSAAGRATKSASTSNSD